MNEPSIPPRVASHGASVPASFVIAASDGSLTLRARRCNGCTKAWFPPSDECPFCLGDTCEDLPLEGVATLYSFSRVHVAPRNWQVPYSIGYADFPVGVRVFAKLDPAVEWDVDAPVRLRLARAADGERFQYQLTAAA